MKTQNTTCNPSVTITVTCAEAMTLWLALSHFEKTHRQTPIMSPNDGKWGHYDCPPDTRALLGVIKGSIHAEHPELFEACFGCKPEDYTPPMNHAPISELVSGDDLAAPEGPPAGTIV